MKTVSRIDVYEINGEETKFDRPDLIVESHWNRKNLVVLKFGAKRWTVAADDLERAIENATRAHR